jgi:outer membrane protein assembly factor BamB
MGSYRFVLGSGPLGLPFHSLAQRGKIRFLLPLLLFISLCLPAESSLAFRDLGIPVRDAACWGTYVGPGKTGPKDTLYLSYGQYEAPLFLLAVHPDTGEMSQYNAPLSSAMGAWGFTVGHDNRIYLGTYDQGYLLRFDPKTETWDNLGRPGGETESFICQLTTAPDGKIWGGTFPSANLFSYDPQTGGIQNFGRMDPDQFYCYPTAGDDGMIYSAILFAKRDLVRFDPKTETKVSLLPSQERKPGRVTLTKGTDGKIYAKFFDTNRWFRIDQEGKLGEVLESEIPLPKNVLPDGRQFLLANNRTLRITNPSTQEAKEINLRYEAAGSYLFVVGSGPEGRVYGSSMLPLHLFSYYPAEGSFNQLSRIPLGGGEIYSMGSFDGKLYFCAYPGARLWVYDPKKSFRPGQGEDANPKDLGPLGDQQDRPRAMIAGPYGKVFIGSYPDYGQMGGAISAYVPQTDERRVYRHVVENQSIASLVDVPPFDLIVAGSSVRGGTGTRATEKEAKLILWDSKEEKKIFELVPVPEAKTILSLVSTRDGRVYGVTDTEKVFTFDIEKREIRKIFDLGLKDPRETSLQLGPGEKIYGLAKEAIFIIDPMTDQVSLLAKPPTPIDSGMTILGRKIYYGSGANLWEFEIPTEPFKPAE